MPSRTHRVLLRSRIVIDEWCAASLRGLLGNDGRASSGMPSLDSLENRVLFSASPMVALVAEASEVVEPATMVSDDAVVDSSAINQEGDVATRPLEIVIVDARVPDYEQLLTDLQAQDDTTFETFVLDSDSDGIEQITEILQQFNDIDAVHIVSHGTDNAVQLGSTWLSAESLSAYSGRVASWGSSLAGDADLLFYGCNLAGSEEGRLLVDSVSALTDADVAASADTTGHAVLGGDWELEYNFGDVQTTIAFSAEAQAEWFGVLDVATFQQGDTNGYSGTLDTYIDEDNVMADNGSLASLRADFAPTEQEVLIRFEDIFGSGPNQIPLGATINSVSLTFDVSNTSNGASTLSLHEMLQTWDESAAWSQFGGIDTNDVEASSTVDATAAGNASTAVFSGTELTNTVQSWANGGVNHGWVLFNDVGDNWIGNSSETGTQADRPLLTIDYTIPAGISNFVPSSQTTDVNTDIVFNGANGNLITVSDGSGDDAVLRTTLTVSNGTVTLGNAGVVTIEAGADGTSTVTFSGTESDINTALNNLVYTPAAGYVGPANLQINTVHTADFDANLEAKYTFDAANPSNVADDDGPIGTHDGTTLDGATQATDTERGKVLELDGSGDAVEIPGLLGTSSDVTLAAWVKLDSGNGELLSIGDNIAIRLDSLGGIYGISHNTGFSWPQTYHGEQISGTGWRHVAYTFDDANDTQVLYLDGVAVSTTNHTHSISWTQGTHAYIGRRGQTPLFGIELDGRVDDAHFYGRSLSASEIASLFAESTSDTDDVAITVSSTNSPPTVNHGGAYTIVEGQDLQLNGSASDVDGDTLTIGWDLDGDGNFTDATGANPNVTWASLPTTIQDNGSYNIDIRVDDGVNAPVIQTTTLNITNTAPTGNADSGVGFTTDEDSAFTTANATANDTDPAGANDPLTITAIDTTGTVGQVSINADGKSFDYDPNGQFETLAFGQTTTDSFTYTVVDGDGGSATSVLVTITINGANDQPMVDSSQAFSVAESASNGASLGLVSASDIDVGAVLSSWTITSGNADGIFAINGSTGELTVTDNTNLDYATTNSYTLSVTVSDGLQTSVVETVEVSVLQGNDPPVAVDDSYGLSEGGTLNETVVSGWHKASWKTRQQITFDNSGQPTDLLNHVVLVKLHASAGDAVTIDYAKTQGSGQDIRFVDGDGTSLNHEIESWDESGYSYVWVEVPQIDGGSSTDFVWMYYDHATVSDGQTPQNIWDVDRVATLHLDDDTVDSSVSGNDGIGSNVTYTTGIVSEAASFDGSDSSLNVGSDASIDDVFAGGGTISAWIRPSGWGESGYGRIADKAETTFGGAGNGDGWDLQVNGTGSNGRLLFEQGFSGDWGEWRTPMGSLSLDTWHHIVLVYDDSSDANDPLIYIDGVLQTLNENRTPSGTARSDAGQDLVIGNHSAAPTRTFDGLIDEFRLSTSTTTADDIAAQHDAVANTFVSGSVPEPGPGGVLNNDSDANGDPLTVTLVTGPDHHSSFSLNADGSFSYTHDGSETTTDSFTYEVSDGVNTDTATVNLSITPVNDNVPVITPSQTFNVSESAANTTPVGTVAATDGDASTTFSTWTIAAGNTDGVFAIDASSGEVTIADNANLDFETTPSYTLTVTVSDGANTSLAETITIDVTDENDNPPIITGAQSFDVNEAATNGTSLGFVAATDVDTVGALQTWTIQSGDVDSIFGIDGATGELTVLDRTNLDFETTSMYTLMLTVSDGANTSAQQSVTINITDANESGIGSISDTDGTGNQVAENSAQDIAVGLTAFADDPDTGDTVTYSLSNTAGGRFKIDPTTGVVMTTATVLDAEASTSHLITVQANSTDGSMSFQDFTIVVVDQNDNAPVIEAGQRFDVAENETPGTIVGGPNADDADVSPPNFSNWTIVGGTGAALFNINAASGEISVVTGATFDFETIPSYTLDVTVFDGASTSALETITLDIVDVNEAPVAQTQPDVNKMEDDADFIIDLTGRWLDQDVGDTLLVTLVGNSDPQLVDGGSYNVATQQLTVSLGEHEHGSSVITLRGTDSGGLFDDLTFTINVAPVNDTTTAASATYSITNTSFNGSVLSTQFDVDGEALTPELVTGPTNGTLTLNGDGSFSYVPDEGFVGTESFTYRVNDGINPSNIATITLLVDDLVPAPQTGGNSGEDEETESNEETTEESADELEGLPGGELDKVLNTIETNSGDRDGIGARRQRPTPSVSALPRPETTSDAGAESEALLIRLRSGIGVANVTISDSLGRLTSTDLDVGASTETALSFLAGPSNLWNELDSFQQSVEAKLELKTVMVGSVGSVVSGFSVGYVLWALRSGLLLSSVLASMPAWRLIDPLAVVQLGGGSGDDEGQSLEQIVEQQANDLKEQQGPDESPSL